MVSFILPAFAYNMFYMFSPARRAAAPKQPPRYVERLNPSLISIIQMILLIQAYVAIHLMDRGFKKGVFGLE